jgi:hypothetical protein
MLKRVACIAAIGFLVIRGDQACASVQVGDSVKLTRGTNQGTGGGLFDVDDLNDAGALDFKTFCVEITEHISLGSTYYVYGISNHNDKNGGLGIRTLGTTAAWLYTQFREGDIVLNSRNEENAMQLGIWRGMLDGSNVGYTDASILAAVGSFAGWQVSGNINPALNTILNGWFTTLAADFTAWQAHGANYTGGVQIMNLKTSPTGAYSQDQLIWEEVPQDLRTAPEPAALAVWTGLAGVAMLVAWRQKGK